MERDGGSRVSAAREHLPTFFTAELAAAGDALVLGGDAAHHARVRRLEVGDRIGLTDGAGRFASAGVERLERSELLARIENVDLRAAPPEVHLYVPVADRDRMLWLAEKATELGVTSWQAVRFRRSASVSARGEGEAFQAKLRARMVAALEQSNGAWLPRIEAVVGLSDLAAVHTESSVLLDWSGDDLLHVARSGAAIRGILVGPEGGIESAELQQLRDAGWHAASLGDRVLRFETAALAAVAILQAVSHG